jgi:hypothetical protein
LAAVEARRRAYILLPANRTLFRQVLPYQELYADIIAAFESGSQSAISSALYQQGMSEQAENLIEARSFAPNSRFQIHRYNATEEHAYYWRVRRFIGEKLWPEGLLDKQLKLKLITEAMLEDVGIKAEISNLEWAQWLEQAFKGKDFGLTIVSHTEPMDIGIYGNPDYYFQYDNAAFRDVMAKLTGTTDPAARTALLQEAQTIIANDYVNAYLFQLAALTVAKAGVQGLWANAPVAANDLGGLSWAQ